MEPNQEVTPLPCGTPDPLFRHQISADRLGWAVRIGTVRVGEFPGTPEREGWLGKFRIAVSNGLTLFALHWPHRLDALDCPLIAQR
jgi:hypothetical protein